jgi:hypothetical protein
VAGLNERLKGLFPRIQQAGVDHLEPGHNIPRAASAMIKVASQPKIFGSFCRFGFERAVRFPIPSPLVRQDPEHSF